MLRRRLGGEGEPCPQPHQSRKIRRGRRSDEIMVIVVVDSCPASQGQRLLGIDVCFMYRVGSDIAVNFGE